MINITTLSIIFNLNRFLTLPVWQEQMHLPRGAMKRDEKLAAQPTETPNPLPDSRKGKNALRLEEHACWVAQRLLRYACAEVKKLMFFESAI